jgi:hypothetical protein
LSGDYLGVVIVGSTSNPFYVGSGNITISGGEASINIANFTNVTDGYKELVSDSGGDKDPSDKDPSDEGPDPYVPGPVPGNITTTFTVSGIPSAAVGQSYTFAVFPHGTKLEALPYLEPLGEAKGIILGSTSIPGSTINGTLYSGETLSGSYLGVVIVGSRSSPLYVGYADISISGGRASIDIADFTDVTAEYTRLVSSDSNNPYIPGEDGDGKGNEYSPDIPGSGGAGTAFYSEV